MPDRHGDNGARVVDVSHLPAAVADALVTLAGQVEDPRAAATRTERASRVSREHLGDVLQAAEVVKAFADAASLDATCALVEDLAADHAVAPDDPRYARKVAAHRKGACRAVMHEVQLLTGSTLTAARDRVRFATAMPQRVGAAQCALRDGRCSWERARIAYAETAHLDPVLAGQLIDRLLAPPDRTIAADDGGTHQVPLSHSGFRARVRRQLALAEGTAKDRTRRHQNAVDTRDACTYPGRDGTATFQASGDAPAVFTAQQRIADLARAAKAAGDPRTLAQLRADIGLDLLVRGVVPGHDHLGDAPAGKLRVIVDLAAILPEHLTAAASRRTAPRGAAGAAFGLGEVPGLGFLTPEQVRDVALRAGSTWARLVTDPVTGQVIDAATTYRVPAGMARLVTSRDHTCRAPGDCGVPATDADLDHDTEYRPDATRPEHGATHPDNLHTMHRGHHNTKTGRFWSSRQHPDGSITWQTLTRQLRTTPFDHHRPDDHRPPTLSAIERHIGIHLALHREHDPLPHVFTDLADLHLLTDHDHGPNDNHTPDCEPHRQINGRTQFFRPRHDIRLEYPEPPPPF